MNHLRAFADSMASAARDISKNMGSSSDEAGNGTGKQYKIGSRLVQEERLLSEGGFGFVHLVREIPSNSPFVIKRILCQDRERYELACREIDVLERLPIHPNLVKYYGHCVERCEGKSREVVLLMEFCPGGHLYDMMLKNPDHVPKETILKALRDIVSALIALQSMTPPVQHRDLKLENVLVNNSGNYVLVDFGSWSSDAPDLSTLSRNELMQFGEIVERYTTLMYRPPEMADLYKGFKISGKVDIWMLGCVLFTLINNKHPFQNASNLAIVNCRYTFSQDECKRYPPKLIELCSWLLAQNPHDRPTAEQLHELVTNWDEEVPLPLPQAVLDRIDKDSRLYGIPSMARRGSTSSKKKSSVSVPRVLENSWSERMPTTSQSNDTWQADFDFSNQSSSSQLIGDLLDLGEPASSKHEEQLERNSIAREPADLLG